MRRTNHADWKLEPVVRTHWQLNEIKAPFGSQKSVRVGSGARTRTASARICSWPPKNAWLPRQLGGRRSDASLPAGPPAGRLGGTGLLSANSGHGGLGPGRGKLGLRGVHQRFHGAALTRGRIAEVEQQQRLPLSWETRCSVSL